MAPINVINNKYTIHNNISYGNIIFTEARIFIELPHLKINNILIFFYKKVLQDDWLLLILPTLNILYIIIYYKVI
jgi:hypothetical protein